MGAFVLGAPPRLRIGHLYSCSMYYNYSVSGFLPLFAFPFGRELQFGSPSSSSWYVFFPFSLLLAHLSCCSWLPDAGALIFCRSDLASKKPGQIPKVEASAGKPAPPPHSSVRRRGTTRGLVWVSAPLESHSLFLREREPHTHQQFEQTSLVHRSLGFEDQIVDSKFMVILLNVREVYHSKVAQSQRAAGATVRFFARQRKAGGATGGEKTQRTQSGCPLVPSGRCAWRMGAAARAPQTFRVTFRGGGHSGEESHELS